MTRKVDVLIEADLSEENKVDVFIYADLLEENLTQTVVLEAEVVIGGKDGKDGEKGEYGGPVYTAGENITIEDHVISAVGGAPPELENSVRYVLGETYQWEKSQVITGDIKEVFNETVSTNPEPGPNIGLELEEDLDVDVGSPCTLKITNDDIEITETFTLQDYEDSSGEGHREFEVGDLSISYSPPAPWGGAFLRIFTPQNYGEVNVLLTVEEKSYINPEYIYHENRNEYPESGELDGYFYKRIELTERDGFIAKENKEQVLALLDLNGFDVLDKWEYEEMVYGQQVPTGKEWSNISGTAGKEEEILDPEDKLYFLDGELYTATSTWGGDMLYLDNNDWSYRRRFQLLRGEEDGDPLVIMRDIHQWGDYGWGYKDLHIFKGITYKGKVVLPKVEWRDYEYDYDNKTIVKRNNLTTGEAAFTSEMQRLDIMTLKSQVVTIQGRLDALEGQS